MTASQSPTVKTPTTPVSSPVPRTPLPWQPAPSACPPPAAAASAAERWSLAIQRIPFLSQLQLSPPSVVYQPPTVIQLSEAAGCSVSELAGAYNDLPVIRLQKERAAPAVVDDVGHRSDAVDYLQLPSVNDTLDMAANAVRARHPAPDAEETFWEADYWEKLKKLKQAQQQQKEAEREKRRKGNKSGKVGIAGASICSGGNPSASAPAALNSASFLSPHSHQGSFSSPNIDLDTSPASMALQSAQKQKRIAKGLLRRARYNESHNPSHAQPLAPPAQLHSVRSASILSQGSVGMSGQTVLRCRARPRSYSLSSQQTDARGFQYPPSSAVSEDGRSAMSDSLRTPSLLPLSGIQPAREAVLTSLDMDMSTSNGLTKSGTTTHSRNSAVAVCHATTPPTPPMLTGSAPLQTDSANSRTSAHLHDAATVLSPVSCVSKPLSPRIQLQDSHPGARSLVPSHNTSPHSWSLPGGSAGNAPLVTPVTSPAPSHAGLRMISPSPSPATAATAAAAPAHAFTVTSTTSEQRNDSAVTATALPKPRSTLKLHRRPVSRPSDRPPTATTGGTGPNSRCTTARPSPAPGASSSHSTTSRRPRTTKLIPASYEAPLSDGARSSALAEGRLLPSSSASVASSPLRLESNRDSEVTTASGLTLLPPLPNRDVTGTRPQTERETTTSTNGGILSTNSSMSVRPSQQETLCNPVPATTAAAPVPPLPLISFEKSLDSAPTAPSNDPSPRASATTVPPSYTPTRETSQIPRMERAIAVHSAAPPPTPPPIPIAPAERRTPMTNRDDAQTAGTSPAPTSPPLPSSLAATQAPGSPTCEASKEDLSATQVSAAASRTPAEEPATPQSPPFQPSSRKQSGVFSKNERERGRSEEMSPVSPAKAAAAPSPRGTGDKKRPSDVQRASPRGATPKEHPQKGRKEPAAAPPPLSGANTRGTAAHTAPPANKRSNAPTAAAKKGTKQKDAASCCSVM